MDIPRKHVMYYMFTPIVVGFFEYKFQCAPAATKHLILVQPVAPQEVCISLGGAAKWLASKGMVWVSLPQWKNY